jgi:hypothetical protein
MRRTINRVTPAVRGSVDNMAQEALIGLKTVAYRATPTFSARYAGMQAKSP